MSAMDPDAPPNETTEAAAKKKSAQAVETISHIAIPDRTPPLDIGKYVLGRGLYEPAGDPIG